MPQKYTGSPTLVLRTQEALILALLWAFVGILYGMLFVFLAELAIEWGLPMHPYFFSGVLAGAIGALIYSSMRLAVLLAIVISPFFLVFFAFANEIVHLNDLLVVAVPIGAVIGGLYGHLAKASRVYRADAKMLAGFSAGFLVALGYLVLSSLLQDVPTGIVVGVMCPLTGLLYILFVPNFIRFRDDILPPALDGSMVGAGVALFLSFVFYVMTHSLDIGSATASLHKLENISFLLPEAAMGGAMGSGLIGFSLGLFLNSWQDL